MPRGSLKLPRANSPAIFPLRVISFLIARWEKQNWKNENVTGSVKEKKHKAIWNVVILKQIYFLQTFSWLFRFSSAAREKGYNFEETRQENSIAAVCLMSNCGDEFVEYISATLQEILEARLSSHPIYRSEGRLRTSDCLFYARKADYDWVYEYSV